MRYSQLVGSTLSASVVIPNCSISTGQGLYVSSTDSILFLGQSIDTGLFSIFTATPTSAPVFSNVDTPSALYGVYGNYILAQSDPDSDGIFLVIEKQAPVDGNQEIYYMGSNDFGTTWSAPQLYASRTAVVEEFTSSSTVFPGGTWPTVTQNIFPESGLPFEISWPGQVSSYNYAKISKLQALAIG